jgi:hypothetical protein
MRSISAAIVAATTLCSVLASSEALSQSAIHVRSGALAGPYVVKARREHPTCYGLVSAKSVLSVNGHIVSFGADCPEVSHRGKPLKVYARLLSLPGGWFAVLDGRGEGFKFDSSGSNLQAY